MWVGPFDQAHDLKTDVVLTTFSPCVQQTVGPTPNEVKFEDLPLGGDEKFRGGKWVNRARPKPGSAAWTLICVQPHLKNGLKFANMHLQWVSLTRPT